MNNNGNKSYTMPVAKMDDSAWELFDSLPKSVRDFFNYAPFRVRPLVYVDAVPDRWREIVKRELRASTIGDYGPDHPEAKC